METFGISTAKFNKTPPPPILQIQKLI